MKKLVGAMLLAVCSGASMATDFLSITAINNDPVEIAVKAKLESLIKRYDLNKFLYTKTVVIDKGIWPPHSHPVLTIPGDKVFVENELDLMANFLHEQFHWDVIENGDMSRSDMYALLKATFPGAKSEPPLGSGDEPGTYSHILVCYLEYKAMALSVGEDKAMSLIKAKPYYTWVYGIVADKENHPKIERLLIEVGGSLWPKM